MGGSPLWWSAPSICTFLSSESAVTCSSLMSALCCYLLDVAASWPLVWVGCVRMMYNLFCINHDVQPVLHQSSSWRCSLYTQGKVADQCVPQAQSAIAVNFSVLVHSWMQSWAPVMVKMNPTKLVPSGTNFLINKDPQKLILLQIWTPPEKFGTTSSRWKNKKKHRLRTYFTCKIWTSGLWGFWQLLRRVCSAAHNVL